MKNELVTIIIPVHNSGKYLRTCLASVQKQEYKKLEIIIIDDASEDNSAAIITEFVKSDERFCALHNEQRRGVSYNRRLGVTKATGKYIVFVDADDYVTPDMVAELLANLDDNELCMCNHYEDCDGKIYPAEILTPAGTYEHENLKKLQEGSIFLLDGSCKASVYGMVWGNIYRKDLLTRNLRFFDEHLWFMEDHFLITALLLDVKKCIVIEKRLFYYRRHPEQTVNSYKPGYFDNSLLLFHRWKDLLKEKKCSASMHLSNTYVLVKNTESAIKREIRSGQIKYGECMDFLRMVYQHEEVQAALQVVNLHLLDRSGYKYMTWFKKGWLNLMYLSLKLHK